MPLYRDMRETALSSVYPSMMNQHTLPYGGITHIRFKGTEHCAHLSCYSAPSGLVKIVAKADACGFDDNILADSHFLVKRKIYSPARSSATATSFTLVPVGPVNTRPSTAFRAL